MPTLWLVKTHSLGRNRFHELQKSVEFVLRAILYFPLVESFSFLQIKTKSCQTNDAKDLKIPKTDLRVPLWITQWHQRLLKKYLKLCHLFSNNTEGLLRVQPSLRHWKIFKFHNNPNLGRNDFDWSVTLEFCYLCFFIRSSP